MMISGVAILGVILGSFAGAQVWRLRARQLVEDKANGEKVDASELKRLKPLIAPVRRDRSRCLQCKHELAWYDLLPIVSWLWLGGKCRYCRKGIGWGEFFIEVGLAIVFAVMVALWTDWSVIGYIQIGLWLIAAVLMAILFAYDARWFLLPDRIMWPLVAIAAANAGLEVAQAQDITVALWSLLGAVLILSGVYLMLYIMSRGAWIGFGDVKLGLALALLVGQWSLAFIALFAANLIGTALVVPAMMAGKLSRHAKVPFGPLLIIGALIAWWWGPLFVSWLAIY